MGPQPGQRGFEGRLAMALANLDPTRPVVVEAESAKVGERSLPAGLWRAMCAAPRIVLTVPVAARAAYLVRAYGDLSADVARLMAIIERLRPLHPAGVIARWQALAGAGEFAELAQELMVQHYDPRYAKHRSRMEVPVTEVEADSLDPADLGALATRLVRIIQSFD
jgi:tRNA 2-selenouridine synthase